MIKSDVELRKNTCAFAASQGAQFSKSSEEGEGEGEGEGK
jgi:hypothetical protein